MDQRLERVVVETPRHRISGQLTLAVDGYRSRVTDALNASERAFIALTDATVERLDGAGPPERHPYLAVNREHVVLVTPTGEDATGG